MSENTDQKNVIDTNVGLVRGAREKVNIHGQIVDVHTYKGSCWCSYVPFAVPPVGKLRFKNPVPANQTNGWEWIYDASSVSKKFPHWSSEIIGSEDCLYLNVFTPTLNNNSNLSVFVWVMADIYNTVVETGMATTLTQSSWVQWLLLVSAWIIDWSYLGF